MRLVYKRQFLLTFSKILSRIISSSLIFICFKSTFGSNSITIVYEFFSILIGLSQYNTHYLIIQFRIAGQNGLSTYIFIPLFEIIILIYSFIYKCLFKQQWSSLIFNPSGKPVTNEYVIVKFEQACYCTVIDRPFISLRRK